VILVQIVNNYFPEAQQTSGFPVWTAVSTIAAIAAAAFAGISVLLARRALEANTNAVKLQAKAISVQTLESIFRDIRLLDRPDGKFKPAFFNTLEYLSFLINHRIVETSAMQDFFAPSIIQWYENALNPDDRDKFAEFTRLYHRLKAAKPNGRGPHNHTSYSPE